MSDVSFRHYLRCTSGWGFYFQWRIWLWIKYTPCCICIFVSSDVQTSIWSSNINLWLTHHCTYAINKLMFALNTQLLIWLLSDHWSCRQEEIIKRLAQWEFTACIHITCRKLVHMYIHRVAMSLSLYIIWCMHVYKLKAIIYITWI